MRHILNISLPKETIKMIKEEAKQEGFVSVSEFIRHVIRAYNYKKLVRDVKQSRKEIAAGKGKVLKSFKDLM
jgi:Arc/MetJ-type ribon-helix-helix transcriptional regulator